MGLQAIATALLALLCAAQSGPTPLQRFLARGEEPPVEYRALRRLEANNPKFNQSAWMTAWTEFDHVNGFRFTVAAEGGSGYIRSKVLRAALEGEQKIWANREPDRASFTGDNYTFDAGEQSADGLAAVIVKPRRKDVLLVDGAMFVDAATGDLVRIEGSLSKSPSFWTRHVEVLRRYARVGGVRVPVAVESTATVRLAGHSTFSMTYQYESVNGTRVGSPIPDARDQVASR